MWNVPRRNVRFTGRDAILEKLHARFEEGGRGGARVALRGISGVGKSQIAIEYAHRFGNDYDIVWWVGARFRAPAREQFAQLAPRLELPVGQELGERIRAVHEALRTGLSRSAAGCSCWTAPTTWSRSRTSSRRATAMS